MAWLLRTASLLCTLTLVVALRHFLEAEAEAKRETVQLRSAASGQGVVHLQTGERVRLYFCLHMRSRVRVVDVRHTNDGAQDQLQLRLGGKQLGEITTLSQSNFGLLWNVPRSSGAVGTDYILGRGRHWLEIRATNTDQYGVEVDGVMLEVDDPELTPAMLECHVFCLEHAPQLSPLPTPEAITPARVVQASAVTSCAEEDNVQVLLFHDQLSKYRITAMHPLYNTGDNYREPNFTHCNMVDDSLWSFVNLMPGEASVVAQHRNATLVISPTSSSIVTIRIQFALSSKEENGFLSIDSGNLLTLTLSRLRSDHQASVSWRGRGSGWSTPQEAIFTPSTPSHTWIVPDFTWAESDKNEVLVQITGNESTATVVIDKLELRRRRLRGDQSTTLYADDDVIVEGVTIDMWWRRDAMNLTLEGSSSESQAHYLRLYRRIPWPQGGFSQVLVLYQDGNLRLLPPTPPGRDWVPFGTSVLLGQTSAGPRPFASISRVLLDPLTSSLTLFYQDGGRATLQVEVGLERTTVEVECHLAGDQALLPFASLRSMWVEDGLADMDRVVAGSGLPLPVLGNWTTLYGRQFLFYRSCISRHNTLSPDIQVDIL